PPPTLPKPKLPKH
nr:Chain B, Xin actin-binding repeat-containing protein 2 [Homo sapiens]